jgi:hypothetical protein
MIAHQRTHTQHYSETILVIYYYIIANSKLKEWKIACQSILEHDPISHETVNWVVEGSRFVVLNPEM